MGYHFMSELLKVENITKIYTNGFVANKDISFTVNANEIHALVGENGAGKTTLMKILFGMEDYQEGAIYLEGEKLELKSPLDAIHKGIGMIHQHFMLVPSLSIAENIVLGIEPTKASFFDYNEAVKITSDIAKKYNFNIDVTKKVNEISVAQMQKVEILKALIRGVKILIMDEPTAVLTPQETKELFEQLVILRDSGYAIIFISHKLEEIMQLCDRVTILRKGRCVGTYNIADMTEAKISRLMIGRDVELKFNKKAKQAKNTVMEIRNLICVNDDGKRVVDNVSLNIHAGEILGIVGIEGNGQKEFSEAICGFSEYHAGSVRFNGVDIKGKSIRELRQMGIAHIPEDRMKNGCAMNLSVKDNIIGDRYFSPQFRKFGFLNSKAINRFVDQCISDFEIACDNRNQPVRMLSGGNIQKVVVAREFTSGCKFILASQPTRGIGVGTTEMIRKLLISMSHEKDVATVLVSADLNELLEVSDRLIVMRKGKIVAAFPTTQGVTEELLGEYMLGIKTMTAAEMEDLL